MSERFNQFTVEILQKLYQLKAKKSYSLLNTKINFFVISFNILKTKVYIYLVIYIIESEQDE